MRCAARRWRCFGRTTSAAGPSRPRSCTAIGRAPVDLDRALRELETLFAAQWSDGRVPHIVFNPRAADYFPGADWWASARTSPRAPRMAATSGLIQPPVHALALLHIHQLASAGRADGVLERVRTLYGRVLAWHR